MTISLVMELTLLDAPTSFPVSLEEAKAQARVEVDAEDELITSWIAAGTDYAQWYTERAIVSQQWQMAIDCFPRGRWFELPKPPLIEVNEITYRDPQGNVQTFASSNYRVDAPTGPLAGKGKVILLAGATWPSTEVTPGAVLVTFTAGYEDDHGDPAIPEGLKSAVRMYVAEAYENRENTVLTGAVMQEVPIGVDEQLWPFVVEKI